jgi:Family of unknown function (DUF6477)
MSDILSLLNDLRRPRLLIRAAHIGLGDYRRERDLRRIMRSVAIPGSESVVHLLLEEEDRLEATRRSGCATYSFSRHIEVLIAMLAEASLLPRRFA